MLKIMSPPSTPKKKKKRKMWVSPAWHFQKQRNKFQSLDPQWEIQGGRKSKIDCLLHCILWDLGKKKNLCVSLKKKKKLFF